jgi:hypothetical protein
MESTALILGERAIVIAGPREKMLRYDTVYFPRNFARDLPIAPRSARLFFRFVGFPRVKRHRMRAQRRKIKIDGQVFARNPRGNRALGHSHFTITFPATDGPILYRSRNPRKLPSEVDRRAGGADGKERRSLSAQISRSRTGLVVQR